ncbi:uncharacterized protein LOC141601956 [Silene latifolia]|uniref:uncharacterized protein LOC141601956 n=1 Tax=Silene latifolia TaxID=37657 RepID=UPI003D76BA55
MQALSICPLKGGILRLPQFDFQFNSTSFGCIRRKDKRKKIEFWFSISCIVENRNGVCNRSSCVSLGNGCFFGFSEIKPVLFGGGKGFLGMCLPIGWSLEEHPIIENVDQGSEEGVVSRFEGTVGDISELTDLNGLRKGEFTLSDDVGSNVDGDSEERVEIVLEEVLEGNLEKGELPLSENVRSDDIVVETRDERDLEGEKTSKIDVRGVSRKLQLAKSVEDVENALKNEGKMPLRVFSSIIRTFGREKKLEPAIALVSWLKEKHKENKEFDGPNLFIYNSLLGAVKQSGEFGKVEVVMNDMRDAGFSPNVVTYNTLMGVYLDDGRAEEALKLFYDMEQKGLSLSPSSYSTALLAYRKMEDGNGALRLFISMREKFMNGELHNCDDEDWETEFLKFKDFTGRVCYQVMRRWLVKDGNLTTNVLKLLIEMDKAGIPPTNSEYERLIWACTREEHYTVVKELYNRIREQRSDISLSVCNHIIWLMGKVKKWWAALEVYEDLLEFGPKPNSMSYELIVAHFNVLLSAAKKRGIWRWGVSLLEKMEAKGLKPRSREWNAVLVACSKASETSAAIEIFKKMVERGEKPTQVSYGALLSALEKGKMYDEAIRVWEHMRKVGIEANLYSYTIMASVYVGLGKFNLVEYIIKEMISTGNNPTVVTYNAIISVCSRNGLGGEAYDWFHRMKGMNIEPNEITYEMLIFALAKDGKPRLAYDMYLRVLNEGLTLSYKAYDAVVQSSQEFGATIDLNALGPRPQGQKNNALHRNNSSEPGYVKAFEEEGIHGEQARKPL